MSSENDNLELPPLKPTKVEVPAFVPLAPYAPSPTGVPVIPPKAVPYLVGLVGLAAALSQSLPPESIVAKIANIVALLGGVFGLASPGLRKKG